MGKADYPFLDLQLTPYDPDCAGVSLAQIAAELERGARKGLSDRAMGRVVAYVSTHLSDGISLEQLAAVACISRFHFARLFRLRTGMSPMQYVKRERIELAKYLLACQGVSISSIAVALGFFDQSHFTRVFRKVTGVSPGHYARRPHAECAELFPFASATSPAPPSSGC